MERVLPVSADVAWALLADLRGHGRWVPLTTVTTPRPEPRTGDEVVARTAGVLLDRMRVLEVAPPRLLRLAKTGPLLFGEAGIEVTALGPSACRVQWWERVHLRGPLPRLTALLLRPVMGVMLWLALHRVARWLRRHHRPR